MASHDLTEGSQTHVGYKWSPMLIADHKVLKVVKIASHAHAGSCDTKTDIVR